MEGESVVASGVGSRRAFIGAGGRTARASVKRGVCEGSARGWKTRSAADHLLVDG